MSCPLALLAGTATTFDCRSFMGGNREAAYKKPLLLSSRRGGLETAAQALVKELVSLNRTLAAAVEAAFGILDRLEVTHINFLFLFAHFWPFLVVFLVLGCVSRVEYSRAPY